MAKAENPESRAEQTEGAGWFVAIGFTMAALGAAASANLYLTSIAAIYIIAASACLAGILMVLHAAQVRGAGWTAFWLASGLLYVITAVFLVRNPALGARLLTLWVAVVFGFCGTARLTSALVSRGTGWGWLAASGVLAIAAWVIIALGWPSNSVWILGLFLAVDLVVQGVMLMLVGFSLSRVRAGSE